MQRYSPIEDEGPDVLFMEDSEGQWVRYADVAALEAKLARMEAPVSDEEWIDLCCGKDSAYAEILRSELDQWITEHAKGGTNARDDARHD